MKTEELIKAKKCIEHVIGTIKHDGHLGRIQTDWIFPDLEKALEAIGGDECSSDTDKLSVEKLQEHSIPKSIADELEEEIEEAYSNDYIRSYSDVGAYMEAITDGLDEESELYKFMFPDDALLGCSHRNIIYLYLVDNDLVKVVEGIDDNY